MVQLGESVSLPGMQNKLLPFFKYLSLARPHIMTSSYQLHLVNTRVIQMKCWHILPVCCGIHNSDLNTS